MGKERACVLSIAGFDPSGGAGILADIKTFEANKVCGMGVVSAITFQNDVEFENVKWIETIDIIQQISVLLKRFEFACIKIGLIKNLDVFLEIITYLKNNPTTIKAPIIWDPIIKASAGFEFHELFDKEKLKLVLKNIFLITPNVNEVVFMAQVNQPLIAAQQLAQYCAVLLKGGHNTEEPGVDYLFTNHISEKIIPNITPVFSKHGSGCVLSAAITAQLAGGNNLLNACKKAKKYTEIFLASNSTLIGNHYV